MKENRLHLIYNGNEKIMNAGFTMQSRYILPVLARMVEEGIIIQSAKDVIQAIFSYKHTEANPYPSRKEIACYLGKSESYVKKALKSIKDAGILIFEKVGRKSTYNFKPFFSLLEKFIIEFKDKKNVKVKIADLLNIKVVKKSKSSDKLQKIHEKYKVEKTIEKIETVQEEQQPVEEKVVLPEPIKRAIKVYSVDASGIEAIEKSYAMYKDELDVRIFVDKIIASTDKSKFAEYYTKCINNAYINGEVPSESKKGNKKPIRDEKLPEWFNEEETKEEVVPEVVENNVIQLNEADKIETPEQLVSFIERYYNLLYKSVVKHKKIEDACAIIEEKKKLFGMVDEKDGALNE